MPVSDSVAYTKMSFSAMLLQHCHRPSNDSEHRQTILLVVQRLQNLNTCNDIQTGFASSCENAQCCYQVLKVSPAEEQVSPHISLVLLYFAIPTAG